MNQNNQVMGSNLIELPIFGFNQWKIKLVRCTRDHLNYINNFVEKIIFKLVNTMTGETATTLFLHLSQLLKFVNNSIHLEYTI